MSNEMCDQFCFGNNDVDNMEILVVTKKVTNMIRIVKSIIATYLQMKVGIDVVLNGRITVILGDVRISDCMDPCYYTFIQ